MTPALARELAHLARLECELRPEDDAHLLSLAHAWDDIVVDCDRDSVRELLAAIAVDLVEAA